MIEWEGVVVFAGDENLDVNVIQRVNGVKNTLQILNRSFLRRPGEAQDLCTGCPIGSIKEDGSVTRLRMRGLDLHYDYDTDPDEIRAETGAKVIFTYVADSGKWEVEGQKPYMESLDLVKQFVKERLCDA